MASLLRPTRMTHANDNPRTTTTTTSKKCTNDTRNNNNNNKKNTPSTPTPETDTEPDTWTDAPVHAGLLNPHQRQRLRLDDDTTRHDWLRPYYLGSALFCILCAFWVLDSLKDPILGTLTQAHLSVHQPRAKLFSVCTTLGIVLCMEYCLAERRKQKRLQQHTTLTSDEPTFSWRAILPSPTKPTSPTSTTHASSLEEPPNTTWKKMVVGHRRQYDAHDNDNDDDDERISSSIFAYVGIPYCLTFGIMAYLLQFHPTVALPQSSTREEWQEFVPETTSSTDYSATTSSSIHNNNNKDDFTAWHILGYVFYAAVESFGSIAVATFWSYTNSTLCVADAERYYGPLIAVAQLGAIVGSTLVTTSNLWSSITLIIVACFVILWHILIMQAYSRRFRPTRVDDTASPTVHYDTERVPPPVPKTSDDEEEQDWSSSWTGIALILRHNYVLYILGASCLYEISLTCLNYQMTLLGWNKFAAITTTTATTSSHNNKHAPKMTFTQFMGHYGQMVNGTSLLLSSLVFPWLMRRYGLQTTLRLFPTLLLAVNLIAFGIAPGNLTVLFISLSLLKAMTYSIHDPAKEILYVPTSPAIQLQAKFWIDVVGARIAKAAGSSLNHWAGSVDRSIRVASLPSLFTAGLLWLVCHRVGQWFTILVHRQWTIGSDPDVDARLAAASAASPLDRLLPHVPPSRSNVWTVPHPIQHVMPDHDNDNDNDHGEDLEGDDVFESPTTMIEMPAR
jgi:ATP/ADP translocase